jgi:hypothetical protein
MQAKGMKEPEGLEELGIDVNGEDSFAIIQAATSPMQRRGEYFIYRVLRLVPSIFKHFSF